MVLQGLCTLTQFDIDRPNYRKKSELSRTSSHSASISRPGSFRNPFTHTVSLNNPMIELKPLEVNIERVYFSCDTYLQNGFRIMSPSYSHHFLVIIFSVENMNPKMISWLGTNFSFSFSIPFNGSCSCLIIYLRNVKIMEKSWFLKD